MDREAWRGQAEEREKNLTGRGSILDKVLRLKDAYHN